MAAGGSISTVLIANRGEIACRIARTCRRLGIRTVAVHSEVDAAASHVVACDVAVALSGNAPTDTYLRGDLLIDAARRAGADAIHPGYGFLAENAAFARAVIDAGLIWIGPPPDAIATMGSKVASKARMRAAGVPVLPDSSADALDDIGFPLLVKASAGGGGRGMRIVRTADELDEAIAAAEREAESAFGDGTVFCERYVERGRHVEVQVMADTHGTVTALFERECSIQRRHQKIIEEAPSPAVDDELRRRLCDAAVAAAHDVGYVGAGTVEFLLEPSGDFAFLEMNTRLQVEHPVTEMVTGLDLVELQIRVAEGQPLPPEVVDAQLGGHAIEVRLTAEDPAAGYLPVTGTFHRFDIATDQAVRVDTGIEAGSEISPHYDSMVAKVIAHAPSRAAAIRRLEAALRSARIHGPTTNLSQLRQILGHPEFVAGRLHTGFLDEHPCTDLLEPGPLPLIAAALALDARTRAAAPVLAGIGSGWRNNPAVDRVVTFDGGQGADGGDGATVRVRIRPPSRTGADLVVGLDDGTPDLFLDPIEPLDVAVVDVVSAAGGSDRIVLEHGGVRTTYLVDVVDAAGTPADPFVGGATVFVDGPDGTSRHRLLPRFPDASATRATGSLVAPMPGAIRRVHVGPGDSVKAGQPLVVLEAMKMEHQVLAPADGTVAEVMVVDGDQVDTGQALLRLVEPGADPAAGGEAST